MNIQIAEVGEELALILPLVILAEGVIGLIVWFAAGSRGGRGARVAAWVGLVTLTLWCGSAAAFVLLHLLLFAFGSGAALLGVVLTTAFMVLMPIGWWIVLSHRARNGSQGSSD
jgi:hypothetical protein